MAAQYLDPPPRNLTAAPALTSAQIAHAVLHGRPGTAMKPFAAILTEAEIEAVVAYVLRAMVQCAGAETRYHTVENGWPDHARRNGAAFPFVRGELSVGRPEATLSAAERAGLNLFQRTCSICHEGVARDESAAPAGAQTRATPAAQRDREARREIGAHHEEGEHDDEEYSHEYGEATEHDQEPMIANLNPLQRAGRDIYRRDCALCHAADGSGRNWIGDFLDPSPPPFTSRETTRRLDTRTLRKTIAEGRRQTSMPAFGAVLNADEIDAVIAYLRRAFFEPQS